MIKSGTEGPAASAGPEASKNYFSQGFAKNQFSESIAMPTRADAVVVLEGSDYIISAATFPTYFLKDLSAVAETQMRLDLDLYQRWIAPALGASVRFVGSEPFDALTNQYNQLIPNAVVAPRKDEISASKVRNALKEGNFRKAAAMCPVTTWPYLLAALAERALRIELDTPGKPGLVGPDGPGAHKDMDYDIMLQGIKALRPFWSRIAMAGSAQELRQLGIEAEAAMMAATGGVNTHRGAIFALGLALNAAWSIYRDVQNTDNQKDMQNLLGKIATEVLHNYLKDNNLHITALRGARRMAAEGYRELFENWLPFYRSASGVGFSVAKKRADAPEKPTGPSAEQKTLLRIMSTLDDTCVVHRVGEERAQQVKREAGEIADSIGHLCERYAQEGISPGGAADMLSLTIFINSIL